MAVVLWARENSWLRNLLSDIWGIDISIPTPLLNSNQDFVILVGEDNAAAIAMSQGKQSSKTKYFSRDWYKVVDRIKNGEFELIKIPTEENRADFFTKPLKTPRFLYLKEKIMGPTQLQSHFSGKAEVNAIQRYETKSGAEFGGCVFTITGHMSNISHVDCPPPLAQMSADPSSAARIPPTFASLVTESQGHVAMANTALFGISTVLELGESKVLGEEKVKRSIDSTKMVTSVISFFSILAEVARQEIAHLTQPAAPTVMASPVPAAQTIPSAPISATAIVSGDSTTSVTIPIDLSGDSPTPGTTIIDKVHKMTLELEETRRALSMSQAAQVRLEKELSDLRHSTAAKLEQGHAEAEAKVADCEKRAVQQIETDRVQMDQWHEIADEQRALVGPLRKQVAALEKQLSTLETFYKSYGKIVKALRSDIATYENWAEMAEKRKVLLEEIEGMKPPKKRKPSNAHEPEIIDSEIGEDTPLETMKKEAPKVLAGPDKAKSEIQLGVAPPKTKSKGSKGHPAAMKAAKTFLRDENGQVVQPIQYVKTVPSDDEDPKSDEEVEIITDSPAEISAKELKVQECF